MGVAATFAELSEWISENVGSLILKLEIRCLLVHCKKYQVSLTKISNRIIFRIFYALLHQRKL